LSLLRAILNKRNVLGSLISCKTLHNNTVTSGIFILAALICGAVVRVY